MAMRLHHIGIAVPDIAAAVEEFVGAFGYDVVTGIIHDPVQTAMAQFLKRPGESSCLELVAPDGPGSKLVGALKRGGGLNHVCYATGDIETDCVVLRDKGLVVIHEPVDAVAFPGRRIAWLMGSSRVLTELVDEGEDAWIVPRVGVSI
jgi:methylmalonyl-CoA/ethylmalonyl-CoA epimerase